MMSIEHLTTSQLQAILFTRGIELPAVTQPLPFYIQKAKDVGVTEVPLLDLATLKPPPAASTQQRQQQCRHD